MQVLDVHLFVTLCTSTSRPVPVRGRTPLYVRGVKIMAEQTRSSSICLVVVVFLATVLVGNSYANFSALIIFGDSTVDVGTNNYLATLLRSDLYPYGRDFKGHIGNGRFCNGLLVSDYVAQNLGLPSPLPYLDPEAQGDKILRGINFGSAGSGWIDSTAQIYLVRSFNQQKLDFKDYRNKLTELVGPSQVSDIMRSALFVVSTGSNDYVSNYFLFPLERENYTLPQWQDLITSSAAQFLQELYNEGVRKIMFASLPAFGCLPAAITIFGEGKDQCVSYINDAAVSANSAMQSMVIHLQSSLPGLQVLFLDTYSSLPKAIQNPSAYGFEETRNACCGTGKIELAVLCNADSPGTCSDASKYLFFDSFHPSQAFNSAVAQEVIKQILSTF